MAAPMDVETTKRVLGIYLIIRRRRRRRVAANARRQWARSWICRRETRGIYQNLIKELELEDSVSYMRYFRMTKAIFSSLLEMIAPFIQRQDTIMRRAIRPEERLAIFLRFMATGESFRSLSYSYRIGERTISNIVKETSLAIYTHLKDVYLKVPESADEWEEIANEFLRKWNYPMCIGALDGKHIQIRQPGFSGSLYYNYNHFFSVVLLALVDANYRFIYVDVGACGKNGDAGIFSNCTLKRALVSGKLNLPESAPLPGTQLPCSYHMIGDDAFPLMTEMMKPFPHRNLDKDKQVFNYRLSRARRVVENAFGILANRFRVFLIAIPLAPEHVVNLVLAATCLHNYLINHQSPHYVSNQLLDQEDHIGGFSPGNWRNDRRLVGLASTRERNPIESAKQQREQLKSYFKDVGSVTWQNDMIAKSNNDNAV